MDLQIKGKLALVTGSTGGIGLEIARGLAIEGAKVAIVGRGNGKVDAAVADIKASGGAGVNGITADVTTAEGAAEVVRHLPSVDILVNNVGIYESRNFGDITDEEWKRYFDVNVLSGIRLSRSYFPGMLERNSGRIIFVSSESALSGPKDLIHYGVTKTAQLTISRGLAEMTKGTKVTVNSVMPGPTRSDGVVEFMKTLASDKSASPEAIEAEFFATYKETSLLQRLIEPTEVAGLVAYLASPLSAATNGAALRIDGGLLRTIA